MSSTSKKITRDVRSELVEIGTFHEAVPDDTMSDKTHWRPFEFKILLYLDSKSNVLEAFCLEKIAPALVSSPFLSFLIQIGPFQPDPAQNWPWWPFYKVACDSIYSAKKSTISGSCITLRNSRYQIHAFDSSRISLLLFNDVGDFIQHNISIFFFRLISYFNSLFTINHNFSFLSST